MDKTTDRFKHESDVLMLIKMVQCRPCLWDKANEMFKEHGERMKAWSDICQHFEPNFFEMEESDQTKLVHFIQGKWQNTRDTFMKSKKKNCFSKYRYHDQLSFLLKNLDAEERQSFTTPMERATPDRSDTSAKRKKRNHPRPTSDTVRRKDRKSDGGNTGRASSPLMLSWKDARQEEFADSTEANGMQKDCVMPRVQVASPPDEDEAFFLSVLPSVRRLSEDDKLEFRLGVLSTIRDIKRRSEAREAASNESPQYSGLLFVSESDLSQIKECPSD